MRHVVVYMDGIRVTGRDDENHIQNVDTAGLAPASGKVDAVLKASKPQNKKELQSYLGFINFYRSFLLKHLSHAQPSSASERTAIDKECLAIMFGVECFHHHLWGRTFVAVTHHNLLLGLLGQDKAVSVQAPPRISAASQATSWDPVLSDVVKVVSGRKEPADRTYSHRAAKLILPQGSLLRPGVEKNKMLARFHVWWPGLDQYTCMVQSCLAYQENETPSLTRVDVLPVTTPSLGATVLALRPVFVAQGLPDVIMSDGGPAFASEE
ncbi:uncharacterized protein LOC144160754 [Haemaphysalis longicornis]